MLAELIDELAAIRAGCLEIEHDFEADLLQSVGEALDAAEQDRVMADDEADAVRDGLSGALRRDASRRC